ncbi:MAG: FixH family protein [Gammaproteobacteria bacterium]|nr:FixH family protein [Gammaproteobacteria bacterium]
MKKMKSLTFLFAMACVVLSACASQSKHSGNTGLAFSNLENAVIQTSDEGKYRVKLFSNTFPIPTNKIHSWTLQVETSDGKPVEDAMIRIHGGMPQHKHGFPTTARVEKYLGEGRYTIDGVKFSMPGSWQMRINIKEEQKLRRDRVVFKIDL